MFVHVFVFCFACLRVCVYVVLVCVFVVFALCWLFVRMRGYMFVCVVVVYDLLLFFCGGGGWGRVCSGCSFVVCFVL